MTLDERLESRLTAGLADLAGTSTPNLRDHILAVTAGTPQRRTWPLQRSVYPARASHERAEWLTGRSHMTAILRIAAVILAAVTVGVVIDPFPPSNPSGAIDPSPSASPSSSPAPLPAEGLLAPGTYAVRPFANSGSDACGGPSDPICDEAIPDDNIHITFSVPDGWAGNGGDGIELATGFGQTLDGAAMIFVRGASPYNDPCDDGSGRIMVGPTAADFAEALAEHPLLDVTAPVDTSVGGYPGKYLELQVPDDPTIQGSSQPASLEGCPVYRPWEPWYLARMGGERWLLWIVDVAGHRVVAQAMVHPETTDDVEEQLRRIIDSIAIEPATPPAASSSPAPLAWSPGSAGQDWPAPVRADPAGGPVVVPISSIHTDPSGDVETPDMPWIDIQAVRHRDCAVICIELGASPPSPLASSNEPWIVYGLVYDTDYDGVADIRLGMDIMPPPESTRLSRFQPHIWSTDLHTGQTESVYDSDRAPVPLCDCVYPGRTPGDSTAHINFRSIPGRYYAWASVIQDGRVVATDYAPDVGWLGTKAVNTPTASAGPT